MLGRFGGQEPITAGDLDPSFLDTLALIDSLTPNNIPRVGADGQTLVNSGVSDDGSKLTVSRRLNLSGSIANGDSSERYIGGGGGANNWEQNVPAGGNYYRYVAGSVEFRQYSGQANFYQKLSVGTPNAGTAQLESWAQSVAQLRASYSTSVYAEFRAASAGNLVTRITGTQTDVVTSASALTVSSLVANANGTQQSLYDRAGDSSPNVSFNLYQGSTLISRIGYLNTDASTEYFDNYITDGSILQRITGTGRHELQVGGVARHRVYDGGVVFRANNSVLADSVLFAGSITWWIDESTNTIKAKVKYSDNTVKNLSSGLAVS